MQFYSPSLLCYVFIALPFVIICATKTMDPFYVAILFTLLPLGGSAPKVSIDLSAEAVAGREPHRRSAMLDSIDLLFTNNQGVGPEMQLRRKFAQKLCVG